MIAVIVAVASAALGGWLAWHHPLAPLATLTVFVVASLASFVRPRLWLLALPALIPLLSFAPWTGALAVEEIDILALALAAGGYARLASRRWLPAPAAMASRDSERRGARVSVVSAALVLLFALSIIGALVRGIMDAGGGPWNWYDGYYEALNSARIAKSFGFALLFAPLLLTAMRDAAEHAVERLAAGFAAGTGVAALAVVWERVAFTGLLNFSSDYRATGSFWEMHVGGAALDGFLALGVPFVVWALMRTSGRKSFVTAGLLLLVSYGCLVTFSRGVYLAVPVSLALLLVLLMPARSGTTSQRYLVAVRAVLAIAATAVASYFVFRAGGYRSLLAVLGVLAVALHLSTVVRGATYVQWVVGAGMGVILAFVGAVAAGLVGKGPYLVYALAFAFCVALMMIPRIADARAWRIPMMLAVFVWLVLAADHVALHWGGDRAQRDVAIVLFPVLVLALVRARAKMSPWPDGLREKGLVVASAAIIGGSVAVMLGGAYMGERFTTSEHDFEDRIQHWRDGLGLLATPTEWVLGKGLGRFPKSYYFGAPEAATPGSHRIASDEGNEYLLLSGPRSPSDWGEFFRVAQRVPIVPGLYALTFDARAAAPAHLHIEVCEQHLLYNGACGLPSSPVVVRGQTWQRYVIALDLRNLTGGSWYAPRMAFFALAAADRGLRVDLDNVTLADPAGRNLIDNGDFGRGMARWFIISERIHLPWHIKSLPLNVLFDQGVIGLVLFALMIGGALWRVVAGRARSHPMAPYIASALIGFLIVGAFDSLLDVPRVALAFYLVLFAALSLREPMPEAAPTG